MAEINAYMNGYSIGDIKFLKASVVAHQEALSESKLETETAKEFLYQHIQTNRELEKKVERLQSENEEQKQDLKMFKKLEDAGHKQLCQLEEDLSKQLEASQQKVERLEKFYNYFSEMYGIGLEVANWHANGETEPFDNFFDSAEEEMGEDI